MIFNALLQLILIPEAEEKQFEQVLVSEMNCQSMIE
jgi:hypothetical protein